VSPGARLDEPSSFTCQLAVGKETPDTVAAMKTVVIGPGGEPFLTDGHHTLTAFFETADGGANLHVRLRVLANFSTLTRQDFWAQMEANKWVWLNDADGQPITVNKLPTGVGLANFGNDKYRPALLRPGHRVRAERATVPGVLLGRPHGCSATTTRRPRGGRVRRPLRAAPHSVSIRMMTRSIRMMTRHGRPLGLLAARFGPVGTSRPPPSWNR
jgi:hypothetical protein